MKFQTAYGKRKRVVIQFVDEDGKPMPVITEQHHKELCDVDRIIKHYDREGVMTHINTATALYGDFTEVNEYKESLEVVIKAEKAFDSIPATVRKRFDNDPGKFMEFITDPKNLDEAIELGLANKVQETSTIKSAASTHVKENQDKVSATETDTVK